MPAQVLYEGVAWTTLSVLDWTTQRFAGAGIAAARLEAQVLLAHVLGCSRVQLYTGFDKPLGEAELASYRGLIKRRLAGESVSYLVGETEFWGLPFHVAASVLVPRPDTETVVDALADRIAGCRPHPRSVHRLRRDRVQPCEYPAARRRHRDLAGGRAVARRMPSATQSPIA